MKSSVKTILITTIILLITIFSIKPIFKSVNYGLDLKGGFEVLYLVKPLNNEELTNEAITNTYKSILNRIDTLGVSEPEITIEGDKIRVKLPGVKDEESARERLSTPAVLSFRDTNDNLLMTASVLGGNAASLDFDEKSSPVVALNIKDNDTFYKVTKELSGKSDNLMVIWLDYKEGEDSFKEEEKTCGTATSNCISAATVGEAFTGNVVIKGNFTREQAENLVDLINSGSLPTELSEISTNTVDASFGTSTLKNTAIAGIITLTFITILMTFIYRLSGLVSSICLFIYTILVFLIFSLIDGVLTLPGIAALILGIGMAIDSSIITLERIKEELRNKKTLEKAYKEGNKKALVSLIDSNITTFIAALILFIYGESSVKGFATMLILTIIVTAIVMIYLSRFILNGLIQSNTFKDKPTLFIGKVKEQKDRNYLKFSKKYTITMAIILIIGTILSLTVGLNKGIDFTGGTSIDIKASNEIKTEEIENLLKDKTILSMESTNENLYIKINEVLNSDEIKELQNSLEIKGYSAEITVISNIVKKDLTENAIKSLILATIGIGIYITFRFTSSFAISSVLSLLTNVLIVITMFTILRIEINFIFIASILTIIGYSINDTIVIFNIIREKIKNKKNINESIIDITINESIRLALKRNILTSVTTISAVVTLLLLGTSGIYEFNMSLLFGLTFGTFTSLFISTYVWKIFELKRLKKPIRIDEDEIEEKSIKGINS